MSFADVSDHCNSVFLAYLENDNLAIVGLEVERPGGSDPAVGLAHHILPQPSDQSHGVQQVNLWHHGVQLEGKEILRIPFFLAVIADLNGKGYKPVPCVAQQMEADSGSPGCTHIAFQIQCRLHGRLYFILEEQNHADYRDSGCKRTRLAGRD